ncbi:MAG: toprim domain-containing protein, partial [Bacteroidota bacterium]
LYDADNAGTNAALRGLDLVLEADLEVRIVPLPDGADPDSFVRQFGGEAFRNFVKEHEQDFVTFIVGVARRRGQLGTPEGVLETVRDVLSSIARIPSPIKQDGYIRIAADELDIPEVQLRPEMQKVLERREKSRRVEERASRRVEERSRGAERQRDRAAQDALADYMMPEYTEEPPPLRPSAPPSPIVPLPEKKLVELMLAHGDRMVELILSNMGLAEFTEGPSLQVVEQLVAMYEAGAVSREPFLQGTHGPAVQTFVADVLMLEKERVSGNWRQMHQIEVPEIDEDPKKSAISSMRLLRMHRIDEAAKRLRRQTARARQDQDTQAELRYAQEAVQLQRELQRVKSGAFPNIDA